MQFSISATKEAGKTGQCVGLGFSGIGFKVLPMISMNFLAASR